VPKRKGSEITGPELGKGHKKLQTFAGAGQGWSPGKVYLLGMKRGAGVVEEKNLFERLYGHLSIRKMKHDTARKGTKLVNQREL